MTRGLFLRVCLKLFLTAGVAWAQSPAPNPTPVWLFLGEAWAQTPIPGAPLPYVPPPLSVWNQGGGPTGNPPGSGSSCPTIPNTNTPVGQACFASQVGVCPTLSNPHDPINFGADKTGAVDASQAVDNALKAGRDLFFGTAGTYKVNFCQDCSGSGTPWSFCTGANTCSLTNVSDLGVILPANVQLECAPNVTLENTLTPTTSLRGGVAHDMAMYWLQGSGVLCGCNVIGSNTTGAFVDSNGKSNPGLWEVGIVSNNVTVEGNTIGGGWGDADVIVSHDINSLAPSGYLVQFNSFTRSAIYGFNTDESSGGRFTNNLLTDASVGGELDSCTNVSPEINQNNIYQQNEIVGALGNSQNILLTGSDTPPGCNYSTNSVVANFCTSAAGVSANIGQNNGGNLSFANTSCTGAGAPQPCCTGAGTGTCSAANNLASYSGNKFGANCSCWPGITC